MTSISIQHQHSSTKPRGLSFAKISPEASALTQTEAVEVFTAMVNAGKSFQQALQAVYISGMSAANEVLK